MIVRAYEKKDLESMIQIWNEVVEEGVAFPQEEFLDEITGAEFFASQTYCGVAEDENNHTVHGLYILHPNNVGEGTEKVDNTTYIWYNGIIKYRWCFYDRATAEISIKPIYGDL